MIFISLMHARTCRSVMNAITRSGSRLPLGNNDDDDGDDDDDVDDGSGTCDYIGTSLR